MSKITKMGDLELKKSWKIGCGFLRQKFQVPQSKLAVDGTVYDPKLFIKGLRRLEAIECELTRRNLL